MSEFGLSQEEYLKLSGKKWDGESRIYSYEFNCYYSSEDELREDIYIYNPSKVYLDYRIVHARKIKPPKISVEDIIKNCEVSHRGITIYDYDMDIPDSLYELVDDFNKAIANLEFGFEPDNVRVI